MTGRRDERHVLLSRLLGEQGSAVVEGIAAVAVVFILFTVAVQAAFALIAHQTAESVVAAAARTASLRPGVSSERLESDLRSVVPGAGEVEAIVATGPRLARAAATIELRPPGPLLRSFVIEVEAEVPRVVAP